jgi:HEAT repeat-containing protein 5
MAASSSGNLMLRQCARFLLPALIEYIAKMIPFVDDTSLSEQHLAAVSEIWKAFAVLFASVPDDQREFLDPCISNSSEQSHSGTRILGILLPTIVLLLRPSEASPTTLHAQSVSQLLSFATSSPASFKEATGKLDPPARERLEQSIRKAVGNTMSSAGGHNAPKPQISLRSF